MTYKRLSSEQEHMAPTAKALAKRMRVWDAAVQEHPFSLSGALQT
jgi:hypothetical protein